jgi:hypothetical protein
MSLDCAAEDIAEHVLFETGKSLFSGDFDHFAAYFCFPNVMVDAQFLDSDTVAATHVTSMVHADGVSRRNPYPIYSVLRRHDPLEWKFQSSLYVILDCETHNAMLSPNAGSTIRM